MYGERGRGKFTVLRQMMHQRRQAKLGEVKVDLLRPLHEPIPEVRPVCVRSVQGISL